MQIVLSIGESQNLASANLGTWVFKAYMWWWGLLLQFPVFGAPKHLREWNNFERCRNTSKCTCGHYALCVTLLMSSLYLSPYHMHCTIAVSAVSVLRTLLWTPMFLYISLFTSSAIDSWWIFSGPSVSLRTFFNYSGSPEEVMCVKFFVNCRDTVLASNKFTFCGLLDW